MDKGMRYGWKEGGNNHTDVVKSVYTKLEKMDGRSRNRLIRRLRCMRLRAAQ